MSKAWRTNLILFLLLSVIIFLTQYTLLQAPLKLGLTADDLQFLFEYRTTPPHSLTDFVTMWANRGPYTTSQFYYIGILDHLFGINYSAFQITNVVLKALATLLVFPLILLFFKNRLLAFLTTIIFGITYGSTGSLQYIVKGTEYLALSSMLIFLILYYQKFNTKHSIINKLILFSVSSLVLLIAFLFSPIRIYPLVIAIPFIEILVWIRKRQRSNIIRSLIKLGIFYLPIFYVSKVGGNPATPYFSGGIKFLYQEIILGNWQLILNPLSGLGYTFLTNDYIKLFGQITVEGIEKYLIFLLKGPVLIYGFLTVLIALIASNRLKIFFAVIFLMNFFFWIVFFYTYHYWLTLPNSSKSNFEVSIFYTASMGFYAITLAGYFFYEWLKRKQDLVLFFSVLSSGYFIFLTWFVLGPSLVFHYPIHWYLVIPSLGSSLFLGRLMIYVYDKGKQSKKKYFNKISKVSIFLILIFIYIFSSRQINEHFSSLLDIGDSGENQQLMQSRFVNVLKSHNKTNGLEPVLFYLDSADDLLNSKFYEVTLFTTNSGNNAFAFDRWLHLQKSSTMNGCLGITLSKQGLKNSIITQNGERGFNSEAVCVEDKYAVREIKTFYKSENFFAFKLKNKELIDIKNQVLEEIEF